MNSKKRTTDLSVLVRLEGSLYGIPADFVHEMVQIPEVVSLPSAPPYVRGVVTLRGHAVPLIDLRVRLGMPSLKEEWVHLVELLNAREQDHVNWLIELENSVKEKREFKLATDPHKCAFGRWYDNFKTDNLILGSVLKKFDEPHKRIHAIAQRVIELENKEAFDEAYAIIESTRATELSTMIQLFEETRTVLGTTMRELLLVVNTGGRDVAISVDSVEAVEYVEKTDGGAMTSLYSEGAEEITDSIGKRTADDDALVMLLDAEKLVGHTSQITVESEVA